VRSVLRDRVLKVQQKDIEVGKIRDKVKSIIESPFQILKDVMIVFGKQMYLPRDKALKNEVLHEAYESRLVTHLGSTKIYRDLKEFYWWSNMKREVAEYVAKYGVC
jgi:hypothetical protein